MADQLLLITSLRLLAAVIAAWPGTIIGLLAPFQVATAKPLTLLNPILPALFLLMGLGSGLLTACAAIVAVAVIDAFVVIHILPWWSCAAIVLSFACVSYTLKRDWAS
ncbi:MAG: hypothetical protein KGS72_20500 [Cyanobacteria bacterium REEB67]|nr:hypothetical protein [Cyanobacteria bacterium REEB67]